MKTLRLLGLCLLSGCGSMYTRTAEIDFGSDPELVGKSGAWSAVELADAPSPPRAWMQQATGTKSEVHLALREVNRPFNGEVRVLLRAQDGELAQGGGIVWRARGEQDYYLARWDPLERNVGVFKVENGKPAQLRSRSFEAGAGWHKLRVWFLRDKIEVWFDHQSLGEFKDTTFMGDGYVGLWTQADARTYFDDLEILEF